MKLHKYYFYLSDNFTLRASLSESSSELLIRSVEIDISDLGDLYNLLQASVDVTLLQLDQPRKEVAVNSPSNKDSN